MTKILPSNRAIKLRNKTCPYCGTLLGKQKKDEEHVIGRKFVPKGALDKSWNLILDACIKCNRNKADLEDDISAQTMQPDLLGRYLDRNLVAEAERKGKHSWSRLTRKRVGESMETIRLTRDGGPFSSSIEYLSPPQIDTKRAFRLALYHTMAFVYWNSFNTQTGQGGWWLGSFVPIMASRRGDWGNELMQGFMEATSSWQSRLLAIGASGFFKIAIRCSPQAAMWSVALEWNKGFRLIATFGDDEAVDRFTYTLPHPKMQTLAGGYTTGLRYRVERELSEERDTMFTWEPDANGT